MSKPKTAANKVPKIVGTGLVSLDIVMGAEQNSAPRLYAGGTCGNVLAILAYLGWDAYPIARLGADKLTERVRRDLRRWEVHCNYLKLAPSAPTPVIREKIIEDGSHQFAVRCSECGQWYPSYRPVTMKAIEQILDDLCDADVFFFDRVSPGAIMLAEACGKSGACVVFEPTSVGDPEMFRKAVSVSDIVKYSCDRMSNLPEIGEIPRPLIEIVTLGADGLQVRSQLPSASKSWHTMHAYPVRRLRDSAGAGDWLTATMIDLLQTEGLESLHSLDNSILLDIINYGQAASAWTCAYEGARGGMYEIDRPEFLTILDSIVSRSTENEVAFAKQRPSRSRVAANAVCFRCGDPVEAPQNLEKPVNRLSTSARK